MVTDYKKLTEQITQQFGKGYFLSNNDGQQWLGKLPKFTVPPPANSLLQIEVEQGNVFFNGSGDEWNRPQRMGSLYYLVDADEHIKIEADVKEVSYTLGNSANTLVFFKDRITCEEYLKERDWLPSLPDGF